MPEAALRKIDCHVHFVGDGSSGSGCWLRLKSIVRRMLGQILAEPIRHGIIHGSDFPIAVSGFGPWRIGLISRGTWRQSGKEPNALERDVFLKHAIGFDDSHLTRMAKLLGET
jgi:hypothetical protein